MGELETKFGDLLRLERERQGKPLEEVAENLRIAESSLRAIEAGDANALPSPVYFNLFSKTYAEALGIDFSATMEAIKEDMGLRPAIDPKRAKKVKQPAPKTAPSKTEAKAAEPGAPEGEAVSAKAEPRAKRSLLATLGYSFAAIIILAGAYILVDQLVGGDFGRRVMSGSLSEESSEMIAYETYDWDVPRYSPSDSLRLTLRPRGESWATILADGDTAVFRSLVPGQIYRISAQYRILLSVALPRVVEIELNGQVIDPVSSETGRISRVEITQANLDSFFNPSRQDGTEVPTGPGTVEPQSGSDTTLTPTPSAITGDSTRPYDGGA